MIKLAPSILAADIMNLKKDIERITEAGIDYLHIDIMDGVFVPNISYGPALTKAVNDNFDIPLDVHLMIIEPKKYIKTFSDAGADIITVHYESENFYEALKTIKENSIKCGISIKPNTDIEVLEPYLEMLDLVLVMTVEPGFGGQKFNENMMKKIKWLRKRGYKGIIEVDGGINLDTASIAVSAGADMLVMGTGMFKAKNPKEISDKIHSI